MTAETTQTPPIDEVEAPPASLETLSPSRASDFKQCPQLFKFKAIDRIEVPPTPAQARGTTAHVALQRLFDDEPEERTPERLFDLFRDAWLELRPTEYPDLFETVEEEHEWGISSLEILRNYFGVEDPSTIHPLDRELDMREELGDITIRGILDRIDETPDGLVITDYKTGKAPPERFALPAFFALKIYALLIRKRLGTTPTSIRLMYLNGPTDYRIDINDKQLDAMERQLNALWSAIDKAIATDRFPPRTGPLCNYCQYQALCPAFADAEIGTAQETVLQLTK